MPWPIASGASRGRRRRRRNGGGGTGRRRELPTRGPGRSERAARQTLPNPRLRRRRDAVVRDFYTKPSGMTSAGPYAPLFEALPGDVTALTRIVQGLGVYDAVAAEFYGFAIPDGREAEIHIRPVEEMLERLLRLDDRPLSAPRPVARRLVCRCRNFTLLLLAMLRA